MTEIQYLLTALGAAALFFVGLGLAHAQAIRRGREGCAYLASKLWNAAGAVFRLSEKTDRLFFGAGRQFNGIEPTEAINLLLVGAAFIAFVYGWFYVTVLVLRDIFTEMSEIKLGPFTLPELLAFLIVLMEVAVGFVLDIGVKSARENRNVASWALVGVCGLFLAALLWGEFMLAVRRVDIVATMVEHMSDLPEDMRTVSAAQIRASKPIFVLISTMFPLFIALLGFAVHRLLPAGAKALGGVGIGLVGALGGFLALLVAAVVALVAGVPALVGYVALPVIGFFVVLIPVGIVAIFHAPYRTLVQTAISITALVGVPMSLGGCRREVVVEERVKVLSYDTVAMREDGQAFWPFACLLDFSESNHYRRPAAEDCLASARETLGPTLILGIGRQSDSSGSAQIQFEEIVVERCDPPEKAAGAPGSSLEFLRRKAKAVRDAVVHEACLGRKRATIAHAVEERRTQLGTFATDQVIERGEPYTDIVGGFRRLAEWIGRTPFRGRILDVHFYSDMENDLPRGVLDPVRPERMRNIKCSDLPELSLAAAQVHVQETVRGRPWQKSETLRRGWLHVIRECWHAKSIDYVTFTPQGVRVDTVGTGHNHAH